MTAFDPGSLAGLQSTALAVVAFRNQAPGFDPRSGEGARRIGGRFNPPGSFPVLYLCMTMPCVVAELTKQAERQGLDVADLLPRELWQIETTLHRVLDLTDPNILGGLDLDASDLVRPDHRLTREIGQAAHDHGFQAIRSSSATGVDQVIAVLPDRLDDAVLTTTLLTAWTSAGDLLA